MKLINTTARTIRGLVIVAISAMALCLVTNGLWAFGYYKAMQKRDSKVHVITSQGTFTAELQDIHETTTFEVHNHIKQFTSLLHGIDAVNYDKNLNTALYMVEPTEGQKILTMFDKAGVQDILKEYGGHAYFQVDTIYVNTDKEPFVGEIKGTQTVLYGEKRYQSVVHASFQVVRVRRSDLNPNGLLITKWNLLNNADA